MVTIIRNWLYILFQFFYSSSKTFSNCWNLWHCISFPSLLQFLHNFRYFLFFSFGRLFWFTWTCHIDQQCCFFVVFSNMRSGHLVIWFVLIQCYQSQYYFFPSFPITFLCSHFSTYPLVFSGSIPFLLAHFTASTFRVLSYHLTYSDPVSFLHLDKRTLCAPHIADICDLPLIPWSSFMLLLTSSAPVMQILMRFS